MKIMMILLIMIIMIIINDEMIMKVMINNDNY